MGPQAALDERTEGMFWSLSPQADERFEADLLSPPPRAEESFEADLNSPLTGTIRVGAPGSTGSASAKSVDMAACEVRARYAPPRAFMWVSADGIEARATLGKTATDKHFRAPLPSVADPAINDARDLAPGRQQ